jgi:spermidine/putrescine-binding protein
MKKLVAATAFAAVALAAQSAAACDWNREASAEQQTVATAAPPAQTSPTTSQAQTAASEATKPVEPTAPVVLVSNDRH